MGKMKRLIAALLLFCTFANSTVFASELEQVKEPETLDKVITSVVSDENYDGWDLEWKYVENFNDVLVEISNDEKTIKYSYDENFNRTQKTMNDGSSITFFYDEEGNLVKEQRNDINIQYIYKYDEELLAMKIVGFVYNDVTYQYIFSDNIITGISLDEEEIARYTYNVKEYVETLQFIDGEWVVNDSPDFIGNINKIRYKGFYYDDETGWYYNDRYFDPKWNRFVDGLNMNQVQSMIAQYGTEYEAEILLASNFFGVDMLEGEDGYNPLLRSSSYGTVETIARVLYAESNNSIYDQAGVAWVVYNRTKSSEWEEKSAYDVVTSGEFVGYRSYWYYNPSQTKSTWDSAVSEAVRLSVGNTPSRKPSNFTNQCYFANIITFQDGFSAKNGVLYFDGDKISKVYIVDYGVVTSIATLKSKELRALSGSYNVFYYK